MKFWKWTQITAVSSAALLTVMIQGCSTSSFVKSHADGPYMQDILSSGNSVGNVEGGEFTAGGWSPGSDGSISYDVPGVAQGAVEVVAAGLNRSNAESIFITLYETGDWNYIDPYILKNPYLVTVSLNNFNDMPQSPFDFLWTMKEFPAGTDSEGRYVDGLPLGGGGYEQTLASNTAPVFPESDNAVRVEWKLGKAGLYLNGKLLAEHNYRPRVFNPQALKLVVGKSPGKSFGLDDVVVKSVTVSLPGV